MGTKGGAFVPSTTQHGANTQMEQGDVLATALALAVAPAAPPLETARAVAVAVAELPVRHCWRAGNCVAADAKAAACPLADAIALAPVTAHARSC